MNKWGEAFIHFVGGASTGYIFGTDPALGLGCLTAIGALAAARAAVQTWREQQRLNAIETARDAERAGEQRRSRAADVWLLARTGRYQSEAWYAEVWIENYGRAPVRQIVILNETTDEVAVALRWYEVLTPGDRIQYGVFDEVDIWPLEDRLAFPRKLAILFLDGAGQAWYRRGDGLLQECVPHYHQSMWANRDFLG